MVVAASTSAIGDAIFFMLNTVLCDGRFFLIFKCHNVNVTFSVTKQNRAGPKVAALLA